MHDERSAYAAWIEGDREAGRALVRRHYTSLFLFFHARVDADSAADLVQETFETLCAKRMDFRGDSTVRTWLFGIARFKLAAHLRQPARCREELVAFDDDFVPVASSRSLGSILFQRSRESLLVRAMRELPFDDQVLLELKEYEGMTARQMAEVFAVPAGTIATRLRRARQRLGEIVARIDRGPDRSVETLTDLDECMRRIRDQMELAVGDR